MSSWVTAKAQWRAWLDEDSVTATPRRALDSLDEDIRARLEAAPFGDAAAPSPESLRSGESMPTLVRPQPDELTSVDMPALEDDASDAASTLVHAPRIFDEDNQATDDGLEVRLQSTDGRLSVTLEPTTPDDGWFIPSLTGAAAAQAREVVPPPLPEPARRPSSGAVAAADAPTPAAASGVTVIAATPAAVTTSLPPSGAGVAPPPPPSSATVMAPPPPPPSSATVIAPPPPPPSNATVIAPPPLPPATTNTVIAPAPSAPSPPNGDAGSDATRAVASTEDPPRTPSRTGNTLIPIDPDAATSQTAGVITFVDADEPPPPPRRKSKIVIGDGDASAQAYDDSGEFARPALEGGGEPSIAEVADTDVETDDVLDSTELVDVDAAGPSVDRPPPVPKPSARPDGPPPPPRTGETSRATSETSVAEPGEISAPRSATLPEVPTAGASAIPPAPPADAFRTGRTIPPVAAPHWADSVFGEHYGALARPGNDAIARAEAEFVRELARLGPGSALVDVGCGDGAHARAWADAGIRVLGLDASAAMIRRAAELTGAPLPNPRWLLGDVCTRPVPEQFDAVVCMGTTFGYHDDDTNREMLAAIVAMVRPGGRLVLHVVNRDYVTPRLPTRSWWQGQGCLVLDEADMDDWRSRVRVRRTVVFEDGRQFEHPISIRVYALHELGGLVDAAGLRVLEVSGSRFTRGRFYGATSPDIWLVAERSAG